MYTSVRPCLRRFLVFINRDRSTILNSIVSMLTALASVYSPHIDHWAVVSLEIAAMVLNMAIAAIVLYIAYVQLSEDFDNDLLCKVHTA